MNANLYFNGLLQEYMFAIADKVIQLVDEEDQSALIALINTLDSSASKGTSDTANKESNRPATRSQTLDERLLHKPTNQLLKGCRNVLKNSSSGEAIPWPNPREHIYQLITINQKQIHHTGVCITKLKNIMSRSGTNLRSETQKLVMISHLRKLINVQESYMVELTDRNQKHHSRLGL